MKFAKRFISVLVFVMILSSSAFALSDTEYNRMKKHSKSFAEADRRLSRVWHEIKDDMPAKQFKILQSEQRDWINNERDREAKRYIKRGYSTTEAYTKVTNERVEKIRERSKELTRPQRPKHKTEQHRKK